MRRTVLSALGAALILSLIGCGEPTIEPQQATPFVEDWAAQIGPVIKDQASRSAASAKLKDRLQQARADEAKGLDRGAPPYATIVEEVYSGREYAPAFIAAGELTPRGQVAFDTLKQVDADGFDPKVYEAETVRTNLDKLTELRGQYAALGEFKPGEAERMFAVGFVTSKKLSEFPLEQDSYDDVTDALIKAPAGDSLRDQLKKYEEISAKMASLQAEVEQVLATGIARYAHDMRYFRQKEIFVHPRHDDYYNDPEIRLDPDIYARRDTEAKAAYEAGALWRRAVFATEEIAEHRGDALLHDKIAATLRNLLTAEGAEAAATIIARLSPSPQYDALKKEHLRYRKIVADGGWDEVPRVRNMRRGQSNEAFKALKKRLQKEGYYPADKTSFTDVFDADLEDAIRAYQATHQLDVDGKPGISFWRSINKPASHRLHQIVLNMQRWRRSNVQHHAHDVYALVNIPDFHVEIWKEQQRQKRIRIVVGNNDLEIDEETEEEIHPNRTPRVSAYIDRVIYNPYWNVTPRIREDEILRDAGKDLTARYKAKVHRLLGLDSLKIKTDKDGIAQAVEPPEEVPEQVAETGAGAAPDAATPPSAVQEATLTSAVSPDPVTSPTAASGTTPSMLLAADEPTTPKAPARPIKPPYTQTEEGWKLDIAAFKEAYLARHGVEADVSALFPYVVPETGLVDISTTDPDNIPPWYAANGYEVVHPGKSWEYVRQLNGDDNALGRVKVIFPNLHDVYLHDTPQKALFRREIRAFSHGCMRMHEPLTIAEWLLRNDGQYDEREVRKLLQETTYKPIFLNRRVPVHVEYFTVRADDEGRAVFLIDIYDYDEQDT